MQFRFRMSNPDEKDQFGIIVTYLVKVRLFLGALSGELAGEVPIILMHPKVRFFFLVANFYKWI